MTSSRNEKRDRITKLVSLYLRSWLTISLPGWTHMRFLSSLVWGLLVPGNWRDTATSKGKSWLYDLNKRATFPGKAPSLPWGQTGSCCVCEPPFLQMPRAGNSSQKFRQVGRSIFPMPYINYFKSSLSLFSLLSSHFYQTIFSLYLFPQYILPLYQSSIKELKLPSYCNWENLM